MPTREPDLSVLFLYVAGLMLVDHLMSRATEQARCDREYRAIVEQMRYDREFAGIVENYGAETRPAGE